MKFILVFTTLIAFSAAQQWFQPQLNYGLPQFGQMPFNYGQMPINYAQPAFRLPYQPYPAFRKEGEDTPIITPKTAQESNSASTRLGKVAPVLMEIRGLKTEIFGNPIQDMAQFRANPPKLSDKDSDERSAKILKVLLLEELIANFLSVTPAPTTAKRTSRTLPVGEYVTLFIKDEKIVGNFLINSELLGEEPAKKETTVNENLTPSKNNENSKEPADNKDKNELASLKDKSFTQSQAESLVEGLLKIGIKVFSKTDEIKPTNKPESKTGDQANNKPESQTGSEANKKPESQSGSEAGGQPNDKKVTVGVLEYQINKSDVENFKQNGSYVT